MGKLRPRKRKSLLKVIYQGSQELGLTPGWPGQGFGLWRQTSQSGGALEIADLWVIGLSRPVSIMVSQAVRVLQAWAKPGGVTGYTDPHYRTGMWGGGS